MIACPRSLFPRTRVQPPSPPSPGPYLPASALGDIVFLNRGLLHHLSPSHLPRACAFPSPSSLTLAPLQVVAVAARDLSRAKEFARKHDIPKAYGSYEELAKDPNVGE